MSDVNYPYRAATAQELEILSAPNALNSIKELADAIDNISLTPGPKGDTGAQGPKGDTGAAGANGISPNLTSITTDILPSQDNQYTLGNSQKRWKSISIGEGTIYMTDATLGTQVALTIDNGVFFIDGIAQAQLPNVRVTNLTFNDNTVQTTAAPAISEPTTYNPVFSAIGLTYTGTPTTGSYMKIGKMVTFRIHVDFATVTNFGTGKYSLTLPFAPVAHYIFRDGGLHHTDTNPDDHYQIAGDAGPGSTTLYLYYSSGAQDLAMDKNSPHAIHTNDYMYISGTYESA